jgi:hypothetical protein
LSDGNPKSVCQLHVRYSENCGALNTTLQSLQYPMLMRMQGRCDRVTKSEQKNIYVAMPTAFHVCCAAISEQDSQGDGFSVPSVILIAASLEVLKWIAPANRWRGGHVVAWVPALAGYQSVHFVRRNFDGLHSCGAALLPLLGSRLCRISSCPG